MSELAGVRGKAWFQALTGIDSPMDGDPDSVLTADITIGQEQARVLSVVPNPNGRFPCARKGEVGLEEAYTLAFRVREAVALDENLKKRALIAIVDVKSQAYGRREETAAIFLAAATTADAYASARMKGHPVIALIVGHAFSGGFLMHGYQANRILAFDDPDVVIHAMHKEAAARITRRSIESLNKLGHEIVPLSYDVRDYAKLGLLHKLLHIENPDSPTRASILRVQQDLIDAIEDTRVGSRDLMNRLESKDAQETRKVGLTARTLMEKQWTEI
jgi:biotin-independent malonate decarboxylase gamma subunit